MKDGEVKGAVIGGVPYESAVVVLCTGVYLSSRTITGEEIHDAGPYGFANSKNLSSALVAKGLPLRRFKTGTPARVDKRSIDFSALEIQNGETDVYPFSYLTDKLPEKQTPCYRWS